MHQLLLLRHAKSSWDDASLPDRERSLNKRGRRAAAAMREAMRELGLAPDVILVSPARRTQETLAALEPWDDTPLVEPMEVLYLATAAQLFGVVRDQSETIRSIMLIGHNPGMHEFGVSLAGRTSLSDATNRSACRFSRPAPWRNSPLPVPGDSLSAGGGQLVRFLTPRDLRDGEAAETAD